MKAITFEHLKRKFGDEAAAKAAYDKVARIGGFGDIGAEFKDGLPALDVAGLSDAKQKQVAEIVGEEIEDAPKPAKDDGADKPKKEGK